MGGAQGYPSFWYIPEMAIAALNPSTTTKLSFMNPTQQHFASRGNDGVKRVWYTKKLWEYASQLPIFTTSIDSIAALDLNTWFFGVEPTCRRSYASRAQRPDDM